MLLTVNKCFLFLFSLRRQTHYQIKEVRKICEESEIFRRLWKKSFPPTHPVFFKLDSLFYIPCYPVMINIAFKNFPNFLSILALAEFLIPPVIWLFFFLLGETKTPYILLVAGGAALLLLLVVVLITTVTVITYKRWVLQLLLNNSDARVSL